MVDVQPAGKQAHQNYVSQNGYYAVSGVETRQTKRGLAAAAARARFAWRVSTPETA